MVYNNKNVCIFYPQRCLEDEWKCASFNFKKTGLRCDLNRVIADDTENILQNDERFTYYEKVKQYSHTTKQRSL